MRSEKDGIGLLAKLELIKQPHEKGAKLLFEIIEISLIEQLW